MDREKVPRWFGVFMGKCAALFPQFKLDAARIEAWWVQFHGFAPDVLDAALLQVNRRDPFLSVKGLMDCAVEITSKAKGVPDPGTAWAEVLTLVVRRGRDRPPDSSGFSHPIVHKAVAGVGGWRFMCDRGNTESTRARFFQLMSEYQRDALNQVKTHELAKATAKKYLAEVERRARAEKPELAAGAPKRRPVIHLPASTAPSERVGFGAAKKAADAVLRKRPAVVVGENMTEEEFEAHKQRLRKPAAVVVWKSMTDEELEEHKRKLKAKLERRFE